MVRARSRDVGSWQELLPVRLGKTEEPMTNMFNSDQQVLDQPLENPVAKILVVEAPTKSRAFAIFRQVAMICVLWAVGMFGFAWWQTGSAELAWPWLRGDRLVFEPMRIDFGQVPKAQVLERQLRVANLSSRPLTLLGSQPSCQCISLDEFPIVLPAGQPHVLTLKIGTPDKSGAFEHFIKFFSDDPSSSSVVVTVTGSVP